VLAVVDPSPIWRWCCGSSTTPSIGAHGPAVEPAAALRAARRSTRSAAARIQGRSAYSCRYCGHHVYPTAGTIFHKSTTSLQLWFWAIYLMSSTRRGISAKQLEREIGVTYKTAHRMFKQIARCLARTTTSR